MGPAAAQHNQEFLRAWGGGLDAAIDYFLGWTVVGPSRRPADVEAVIMDKVRSMAERSAAKQSSQIVLQELDPPAIGRLDELRAPTLVVVGDLDQPYILDLARRVAAEASDAEVVVISGAAHMVNMEKPDEFNETVRAFLAGR